MTASLSRDEIARYLCLLAPSFPAAGAMAALVRESVTFAGAIVVEKRLPIGAAVLTIQVTAMAIGSLEIDIRSATVLGSPLFGLVRKVAGDYLLRAIGGVAWMRAIKASNGNIWLTAPGLHFQRVTVTDHIEIQAEIA